MHFLSLLIVTLVLALPLVSQAEAQDAYPDPLMSTEQPKVCMEAVDARGAKEFISLEEMLAARKKASEAHRKSMLIAAEIAEETRRLQAMQEAHEASDPPLSHTHNQ